MTDPFAVQIPEGAKPVHGRPGRFFLRPRRGHELHDYTLAEGAAPYLGVSADKRMLRIFLIILGGIFAIFLIRAASLQLINGARYRGIAEGNRIRIEIVPASRGLMFDRQGVPLVRNMPQFVLTIRPVDFPHDLREQEQIFAMLADYQILREPIEAALREHPRSVEWIPVSLELDHGAMVELTSSVRDMPGVSVQSESRRYYDTGDATSFAHVLGYVGRPSVEELVKDPTLNQSKPFGKTGLESWYEDELRGVDGRKRVEVDALGNEEEILAQEEPRHGTHILLNLDSELQKQAEQILARTLKAARKERGAVVMLDPRDGGVRALVSIPAYNANEFTSGLTPDAYQTLTNDENRPLFPRATAGTYPSGSTIKPIFAAGALAEGVITPGTTFLSTGGIQISQWFFPDWRAGGHGPTNVYHAIADSVNTFFYYVGGGYGNFEGLGPGHLALWAKRFGLGVPTGIDFPGEAAGFVPTVDWKERERGEPWYIGDTYHMAIGQGDVLVTPLQMAVAAATIANGGVRYEPKLAAAVRDADGVETLIPPVIREQNFIDPQHLSVVRDAMRRTITDGSGRSLSTLPVAAAGKTGTAEWSQNAPPHSWFVGFAPYRDPEIAIAVLVEEGGAEGSTAVPVAREILAWYFNQKR